MSFELTTLGQFATIQGGYAYKSGDFLPSETWPVLKIKNVRAGRIDYSDVSYVSDQIAEATSKWRTKVGDVLISMTGSGPSAPDSLVGRVGKVRRGDQPALINQRVGRVLLRNEAKVDLSFLYHLLSLSDTQQYLVANATGSANQVNISAKTIESVPCPNIDFYESKAISGFLDTLDDRITLLRETNATLEAIAQALFKSWFVDFDPVRAKQQGLTPDGMDEATAALFPDGFEASEPGTVPRGWRLAQFADFIERQAVGKKYDQKSAKTIGSVPILDQGKSGIIGFHDDKPGVTASLDEPVVVFANHTCYMRLITFPFSAIQNVLPFKGKGVDTVWAYYATQGKVKFSEYKGHWPDFTIKKAPLPDEQLTVKFREAVDPLVRRMKANDEQAENLAELRDTLLPRLISGQLRLPDASVEVFG